MKKIEQACINSLCELAYEDAMEEFESQNAYNSCVQLRSCKAFVYETKNYYLLKSYSTIVAVINKGTDVCYDVLRMVYGYTATSGKHIAKFRHDYGSGKWGCETTYTYRYVFGKL